MNISASNTLSIRQFYGDNRNLVSKANRKDQSTGKLADADVRALKRAASKLSDFNYEEASATEMYEKLKAFADTYNYTLESGKNYSSENSYVKRAVKELKNLTAQYADELKSYGFSVDSDGYLSVSDSSVNNISGSTFSEMFGKDSEYMGKLSEVAKKYSRHIDLYL